MPAKKKLLISLESTNINGTKCMQNKSLAEKVAWGNIVTFSFAYSINLMRSAIIDWNENPVITTIASTSIPVQMLQFPSITVCPEELTEFDRWAFIEEMLNNMQFSTLDGEELDFNKTAQTSSDADAINEMFGPSLSSMLARMYTDIILFTRAILYSTELEDLELILASLKRGVRQPRELEHSMLVSVAKIVMHDDYGGKAASQKLWRTLRQAIIDEVNQLTYYDYGNFHYYENENEQNDTGDEETGLLGKVIWPSFVANLPWRQERNESGSQYEDYFTSDSVKDCKKDDVCKDELRFWHWFFIGCNKAAEFLNYRSLNLGDTISYGGFGTFLAHFSRYIGSSFTIRPGWAIDDLTKMELQMHEFFASLYNQITRSQNGTLKSLHDVPIILGFMRDWSQELQDDFPLAAAMPSFTAARSDVCTIEEMTDYYSKWFDYMHNVSGDAVHPCKGNIISACCHYYGKMFARSFDETMKIMRFSSPQGKGSKNMTHLAQLFGPMTILGHEYQTAVDVENNANYLMQLIPMCKYARNGVNFPCNLFEPMLTRKGICHSFNSESVSSIFKASPYMDSFSKVFNIKPLQKVDNALGTGDEFGLTFLIDGNTKMRHPSTMSTYNNNCNYKCRYKSSFTVSVNSKDTPFDHYKNVFTVEAGMHSTIKVVPAEVKADEGLIDLSLPKRKCRFAEESDTLSLFTNYTHSGCQFECMLNHSKNHCGCIPWNYPHGGKVEEICDMFGNMCFYQKMKDIDELNQCSCLSDCNLVSFTYSETVIPIRSDLACHDGVRFHLSYDYGSNMLGYIESYINSKYDASTFALRYEDLEGKRYSQGLGKTFTEYDLNADLADICDDTLTNDIAMVTVKLGSSDFVRSVQSRRVTFADQLAALGGIIGLFTGMSILSFFEVAFWIYGAFVMILLWLKVYRRPRSQDSAMRGCKAF